MNTKQQEAYDAFKLGTNIVLTGPAGTGKSYTLHHMFSWAEKARKRCGITASTGLSAFLIGGRTIHSFLGIGLGKKPVDLTAQQVKHKNKPVYTKLLTLDILVIDEISMIDSELLDYISEFLKIVRNSELPFGGVQVVLCGDFCQLPPVEGKFCFFADVWKESNFHTIVLEDLIRQGSDSSFQKILKELRWGCSKDTLAELKKCMTTTFAEGIIPTKLYSTNKNVDNINLAELEKVKKTGAVCQTYKSTYQGSSKSWCQHVPEAVELCEGAQVMCTTNLQGTEIFNGTRGVVVKLGPTEVHIKLVDGQVTQIPFTKIACLDNDKLTVTFMPLRLAYAISIHKSQGLTLDALEIDVGPSIFEYGQAYVAISRAKTLGSIRIVNIVSGSFRVHPLVKDFYNGL